MIHESATITVLQADVRELRDRVNNLEDSRAHEANMVTRLGLDVEGVMARLDLTDQTIAALQPCPEPPATELAAYEPGPARVEFLVYDDPDALGFAVAERVRECEADGWTVESAWFAMQRDEYGACVVFRLPAPAKDTANGQ